MVIRGKTSSMERVSRKDDERLYQPRIHSRRIRELHKISEITGQPMTVILDIILRKFYEDLSLDKHLHHDIPVYKEEG